MEVVMVLSGGTMREWKTQWIDKRLLGRKDMVNREESVKEWI
jgi:hypothetical protein